MISSRQTDAHCYTHNLPNQWVHLHCKQHALLLTAYTLCHDHSTSHVLRNWMLEGSANGIDWIILRDHPNDNSIVCERGASATFTVQTSQAYSHFRISQTGINSSGTHVLTLAGIELYGSLAVAEH